jgi:hypothetical protein
MSDKNPVTKNDQKRHTHSTINGIEDAIANQLNIISELEIALLRARRALEILQELRQGPYSYQRGSQKRPRVTILGGNDDNENQEGKS